MNNQNFTKVLILGLILNSIFSGLTYSQDLSAEQVFEKYNGAVLEVLSYNERGVLNSTGTAVLINAEGLAYTDYHLLKYGLEFLVRKDNEIIKDAIIVGADPLNDILIIKIPTKENEFIPICKNENLIIGEKIYAIGNPLGYNKTISQGIISNIRTNVYAECNYKLIQFTASISHGSSGGALINSRGELIGITSLLCEYGQNLNFAYPVNYYNEISLINFENKDEVHAILQFCTGYNFYLNGDYKNGKNRVLNYLDYFDKDINGYMLSAKCDYNMEDYESAYKSLKKINKIKSDYKYAYPLKGAVLNKVNHFYEALSAVDSALMLDCDYEMAYKVRASIYKNLKQYDNAISDYSKLIDLNPTWSYAYINRAELYAITGDTAKAITDLYNSYFYEDNDESYYYTRAELFHDFGLYSEAVLDLTNCIKIDPENSLYYLLRGNCKTMNGNKLIALIDYETASKLNPLSVSAFNNLGYSYIYAKDYELAIRNFNRALQLDKRHFDSYLGLAIVSYLTDNNSNATMYILKAEKIEPDIKNGIYGLKELQKEGYFWIKDDTDVLNKIFKMMGYKYEEDKNKRPEVPNPFKAHPIYEK